MTAEISPNIATSTEFDSPEENESFQKIVSFSGRNFKGLRVLAGSFVGLITWVFHKAMAAVYSVAGRKDLKLYHLSRSDLSSSKISRLLTYCLHSSHVVNFSANIIGPQPIVDVKLPEQEKLSSIYGEKYEEMLQAYPSDQFPLDEDKLHPLEARRGVCLGASLHYISLYLNDEENSVERISQQFSQCATKEAQITQIFYKAQDLSPLLDRIEQIKKEGKSLFDQAKKELIDDEKLKVAERQEFSDEDTREILSALKNKIEQRKAEINHQMLLKKGRLQTDRFSPLAKLHGLQLEFKEIREDEESNSKEMPQDFGSTVSNFQPGAYLICLSGSSNSSTGHAIAIIKQSDGSSYIFDPNFGSLRYDSEEKFCSKLWDLSKTYYNKKGDCEMTFFNCHSTV